MNPRSLGNLLKMETLERAEQKLFPNGDSYNGDFFRGLPHGYGKYTWSDKTVYVGDWELGKMTGNGKMIWPSGSVYEGEFSGGYFHGKGDFKCPNKYTYFGSWRMNTLHGFGKKDYLNSDSYEGSWKEGAREGSGKYVWRNGNYYIGTWKEGFMFGRGVMKWTNGDVFYGFWLNGLRHGSGIYRFNEGGYYFGNWTKGLKDGRGTFYPVGSKHPPLKRWGLTAGYDGKEKRQLVLASSKTMESRVKRSMSDKLLGSSLRRQTSVNNNKAGFDHDWMLRDLAKELSSDDSLGKSSSSLSSVDQSENKDGNETVYEREYMQGILIRERIKKSERKSSKSKQNRKFPATNVKRKPCIKIFSGYQSHYLMLNLQLGIRYTVGKITPVPAREVRSADFGKQARIKMFFPRRGSQLTPPHYSRDFHWKDYCPMVFRNLRELFKLDAADYMMSICGDDGLRELSSSGKSGCIFYLSHDDKFVIKTLRKDEVKVLLKMLPGYYEHVRHYENTLITKFFGLHRIKLKHGRLVRFIVMGNMFYTELKIHRRYDLKGSTYGRCTNKDKITETTTLKDLDLAYEFQMDRLLREALFKQLSLDCKFLESQKIIDYSLLLGLHFRAPDHLKPLLEASDSSPQGSLREEVLIPPTGLVLVNHEPSSVSTTPGPHIRGRTPGDREVDLVLPGTARLRIQLGVNMPARGVRKLRHDEADPTEVELLEVYDVVLYLGIIDILQDYCLRKKAEHMLKSTYCDPMAISVLAPRLYSKRFLSFLERIFPPQQQQNTY
ncbi:hypothetical protein V2J09_009845 [Rumex salicifolius]